MRIVVLLKQVPDTWSERHLDAITGRVERSAATAVSDEIDDRALEVALQYKDAHEAEVTTLALGPAIANESLRKSLAVGADNALHILDGQLVGSDVSWTSAALAAGISRLGFDLVIAGAESTDGRGGVIPAMVAEHLGVPHLTYLDDVALTSESVSGDRVTDNGVTTAHAALPAVISVTERAAEPRFPNFKGIMRAKKKPLDTVSATDLGFAPPQSGHSIVVSVTERPSRTTGTIIKDDGDAAVRLAEYLANARLI